MPRLKTRRSSSSSTWRASQSKTGGRSQASQSIRAVELLRQDAAQIPFDPAARHVRERVRPVAQAPHVVEVEPCRRQQVGPVVVLQLEHAPREGEAVRVNAGRGKPDDDIALVHGRTVDQAVALDDADACRCEVELIVAVDVRELRRLAADERHACRAADLGGAFDELRDLLEVDPVRRDVVEQEQRLRARRDHVVDAVRGHVGPARPQRAAVPGDDRLRPDRVHRGGEQAPLVERIEPGEGAEARGSGRLDGRAETADDGLGGRERDARSGVRAVLRRHGRESTPPLRCVPRRSAVARLVRRRRNARFRCRARSRRAAARRRAALPAPPPWCPRRRSRR